MIDVHEGQCGLCVHFGEHGDNGDAVHQIRVQKSAPEDLVEDCGHPRLVDLRLQVTPISGCEGFEPANERG